MQDSKEIITSVQNEVKKQQEKINYNIKKWIKTNFYKIISILSLFLATLSTTGIIMISINNKNKCYLDHDYHEVWGNNTTIWEHGHTHGDTFFATLYFSKNKANFNDIKWDGIYPDGYFRN